MLSGRKLYSKVATVIATADLRPHLRMTSSLRGQWLGEVREQVFRKGRRLDRNGNEGAPPRASV